MHKYPRKTAGRPTLSRFLQRGSAISWPFDPRCLTSAQRRTGQKASVLRADLTDNHLNTSRNASLRRHRAWDTKHNGSVTDHAYLSSEYCREGPHRPSPSGSAVGNPRLYPVLRSNRMKSLEPADGCLVISFCASVTSSATPTHHSPPSLSIRKISNREMAMGA
jgi:hypothetical protein